MINTPTQYTPQKDILVEDEVLTQTPSKVILFNDDVHTFDEVIGQLILAVHCNYEKAETIAWEVHTKGKSTAYSGEMKKCLIVSSILEEIQLHTQIEI